MMPVSETNKQRVSSDNKQSSTNSWLRTLNDQSSRKTVVAYRSTESSFTQRKESMDSNIGSYGGPMPNIINSSKDKSKLSTNKPTNVSNNIDMEENIKGTQNNMDANATHSSKENIMDSSVSTSNAQNYKINTNSVIDSTISNRKSSINFTPYKVESFEKKNMNETDVKNVSKNKKSRSKQSKNESTTKNLKDVSYISRQKGRHNESTPLENPTKLMQRAIERSKNDMGILKRRDDPPPPNIHYKAKENFLLEHSSTSSSDDMHENEKTLMPKRVQRLLSSDSVETDDEERKKEISDITSKALAAASTSLNKDESVDTSNNTSKGSRKRKQPVIDNPASTTNDGTSTTANRGISLSDNISKKTSKTNNISTVESSENQYRCSFVDGLNGRCREPTKNPQIYCDKHEKIVRDIESAFDNLKEDTFDSISTTDNKKKSYSNWKHGLTTENRDILLDCLDKIKNLETQEESFATKGRMIQAQIHSLNRLRSSFEKQRRVIVDEKLRLINTMQTLIHTWSPLFINVTESSDKGNSFDVVLANQKVVTSLLSQLNENQNRDNDMLILNDPNSK